MSEEAQAVWEWINGMGMKSGDFVDLRAFNVWCATKHLTKASNFIPAMEELVSLGWLINKNEPGAEPIWDYWVA